MARGPEYHKGLIFKAFWKPLGPCRGSPFRRDIEKIPVCLFYTSFATAMSGFIGHGGVA
jgi:hypothetical protein